MNNVYLALGSNLDHPLQQLQEATALLKKKVGKVVLASSVYQTKAWGYKAQPDFLNQVLHLNTKLAAPEVLEVILQIESSMGRIRSEKNAARVIDIDILFFNDEIIDRPQLKVPHPLIQDRNFVLVPLKDIAPDYRHPVIKKTVTQLWRDCTDDLKVKKISEAF